MKRNLHAEINLVTDNELPEEAAVFERCREIYAMAKVVHGEIYQALRAVQYRQAQLSCEELVDCQFALRESAKLLDDIRKECEKTQEVQAKLTCAMWVMQGVNNGGNQDVIHGTHCKGSPQLATRALIPKFEKDPEKYASIMAWLGIPEDLWDKGVVLYDEGEYETEIVKINYRGFEDYLDRLVKLGYALPPGIQQNETWTEASVRITRTQDLL